MVHRLFELNKRDICLWLALVIMGFFLTAREFLLWLNTLNPYANFLVYYTILYGVVFTLSKLGLITYKQKVSDIRGTTGLALFLFGLFSIVNWENPYIQYVTTGNFAGASQVFYGTEDAMIWDFVTRILGITDVETARLLSFMVLGPLISLVGLSLSEGKPRVKL